MSTQPSREHVAVEPKRFEQTLSFFPIPDISSKWTGSPRKSNELSPLAKTSCTKMDSQSVLPPLKAVHKKPVGLTKGNYLNSFNLHPDPPALWLQGRATDSLVHLTPSPRTDFNRHRRHRKHTEQPEVKDKSIENRTHLTAEQLDSVPNLPSFKSIDHRNKMAALLKPRDSDQPMALAKPRDLDQPMVSAGYDSGDDLQGSMTLPRIEAVLRSEGVQQNSISQQIDRLKERTKRSVRYKNPDGYDLGSSETRLTMRYHHPPTATGYPLDKEIDNHKRNHYKRRKREQTMSMNNMEPGNSFMTPKEDAIETEVSMLQKEMTKFTRDIEHIRWLSEQQLEKSRDSNGIESPKVLLIPSNVPGCQELVDDVLLREKHLLPVLYDFTTCTFQDIEDLLRSAIEGYKIGCKIKSILLYCQGGGGYFYMLKQKVVTRQKLYKKSHAEMIEFWKKLSVLMTKVNSNETCVHIMGCNLLDDDTGYTLLASLKEIVRPNVVHFEAPDERSERGKEVLRSFFDYEKYLKWKQSNFR